MNKQLLGYGAGGLALAAALAVAGTFGYRHYVQGRTEPAPAAAATNNRVLKIDGADAPTVPPGAVKIAPIQMKKPPAPASQPAQATPSAKPQAESKPQHKPQRPAAKPPQAPVKLQMVPAKPQQAPSAKPKPTTQTRAAAAAPSTQPAAKKNKVIALKGAPGAKGAVPSSAPLTEAEKATLSTVHQVRTLRNSIQLWGLRHNGKRPDFAAHPNWEQFTRPGVAGQVLSQTPVNPLNGYSAVMATSTDARPGQDIGGTYGYVYSAASGKLWATDSNRRVLDEAAIDTLSLEVRAVRELSPREAEQYLLVGLQSVRSQIGMYRLQHGDRHPDFAKYPAFEQLLNATTADGTLLEGPAPKGTETCGPYLLSTPVNPVNGRYKVAVVSGEVKPGQKVGGDAGFVFSSANNQLHATDAAGCVFDEAQAREAYTPRNATAAAPMQK